MSAAPPPRLTVAMVTESYVPRVSGVVHAVRSLTAALRAAGHRVLVVAPRYPGHTDTEPDVLRLPSFLPPGQPDFPLALPARRRVARTLAAAGVAVVHAHSPFIVGRLALGVARRLRAPVVFTHHTLYHEYVHYVPWVHPALSRRLVLRYTAAFARRCHHIIAPSRYVADLLRAQGVGTPVTVMPSSGVDVAAIGAIDRAAARARLAPGWAPLLVTVSRLAPEKSVEQVLRAFRQVVDGQEAYLLIVGDGPSRGGLEALAADLALGGRVRFTGALPHEEALAAMAAADLFVFASQTETQGLVLVEAMAAGTPVVAVARGGAPEVVTHGVTGLVVEPDPAALAAAVRAVLADPERRAQMGARAQEAARAYATPAVAARLAALYEEVLRRTHVDAPHRA